MCNQWYKRSSCCLSQVEGRVIEDVLGSAPEISGRGVELRSRGAISSQDSRAIRRRTWNREEVNLLNLKNLTALPCWLTSWLYLLVEAPIYFVTYVPQEGTVFIFSYNRKRYLDMSLNASYFLQWLHNESATLCLFCIHRMCWTVCCWHRSPSSQQKSNRQWKRQPTKSGTLLLHPTKCA